VKEISQPSLSDPLSTLYLFIYIACRSGPASCSVPSRQPHPSRGPWNSGRHSMNWMQWAIGCSWGFIILCQYLHCVVRCTFVLV